MKHPFTHKGKSWHKGRAGTAEVSRTKGQVPRARNVWPKTGATVPGLNRLAQGMISCIVARMPRPPQRWREKLPGRRPETYFRWRGGEVSRLENLADAVFGFALTLLVVSTEVPRDFASLMRVLREFPAFIACFALLLLFWNEHYRFFRRYGLEDFFIRSANYAILLLVLFSVYPLKFMFTSLLGGGDGLIEGRQWPFLFRIYGLGFASIWTLYALMVNHALRLREHLGLTPVEVVMSRLQLNEFRFYILVCFLSIGLSYLPVPMWMPGVIYCLVGPLAGLNGWWHGRKVDALLAADRRQSPT